MLTPPLSLLDRCQRRPETAGGVLHRALLPLEDVEQDGAVLGLGGLLQALPGLVRAPAQAVLEHDGPVVPGAGGQWRGRGQVDEEDAGVAVGGEGAQLSGPAQLAEHGHRIGRDVPTDQLEHGGEHHLVARVDEVALRQSPQDSGGLGRREQAAAEQRGLGLWTADHVPSLLRASRR